MSALVTRTRPAAREPSGLLVLHHGRGADESDLLPLAEALDPQRRLHVVFPRGPLPAETSSGYRWYLVPQPGQPDADSFEHSYRLLAQLHDELWQQTGIAPGRTVLGGFSMGAVMSYALALTADRRAPAGILAFSGFLPKFAGWAPCERPGLPAFVAHGTRDKVIDVQHGRDAVERLGAAGLDVEYDESQAAHHIDPRSIPRAAAWLAAALPARLASPPTPRA